jgi:hypothetical protein
MKQLCLATGLFAAMACAGLYAQTVDLRANVPFDFRMGKTLMPAGEYVIHHSAGMLSVRAQSGRTAAFHITLPESRHGTSSKGALVFNRYGDSYFLSKIWAPDSRNGLALLTPKREKELASGGPVYSAAIPAQRK